ncbi:hypothetical protein [Amycolatopsis minnesotensis]|uniref:Uncharacterized protein n=1 Tax=Amycolatopsis minnesotensis TaxID=337894 RepID=A0ABP5CD73_9PSEU
MIAEITPQIHSTVSLDSPDGSGTIDVDKQLGHVVERIWGLGHTTMMSCQDIGHYIEQATPPAFVIPGDVEYHRGLAWIKMPLLSARDLLDDLKRTPFRDRLVCPWRRGSWRMLARIGLSNDGGFDVSAAHLYFPANQIPELQTVLSDLKEENDR